MSSVGVLDIEHELLSILKRAKQSVGTRTFFIARTGNEQFSIYKVLNQEGCHLAEGDTLPLMHSI